MSSPRQFHKAIHQALANPVLQTALERNAERRINAFQDAFRTLPVSFEALRQQAHQIRQETITHWSTYLETFIRHVRDNQTHVHLAATSEEARQIVLKIAHQAEVKKVVKSKSMVSEEIGLNQALQSAGIEVIETDLGEYIVQLRGEPPAHIITPAVHLTRKEVGHTFHEKLGIPPSEDVAQMTAAARAALRAHFLEADMGISGVNFGVAETGSLCLITNEGNGRMVTTLPRVHIALMGAERLVANLGDLAIMLSLLPRSATGQKLTVYTSLIHSPRQKNEVDGAQERHLVILDNGRRQLQGSPLKEILYCIRCGACLNVCPVFREIGGHAYLGNHGEHTPYPGPMGSIVSPGLFGCQSFGNLPHASSLCGACQEVCPVAIDLPGLLLHARALSNNSHPRLNTLHQASRHIRQPAQKTHSPLPVAVRLGLRLYSWLAVSPQRFRSFQRAAGALGFLFSRNKRWLRIPPWSGWGLGRDFPRPALYPFRDRFHAQPQQPPPGQPLKNKPLVKPEPEAASPQSKHSHSHLAEIFAEELRQLGGEAIFCRRDELAQQIKTILQINHGKRLLTWGESELPPGILDELTATGVECVQEPDASIKTGLTGSWGAIADTGTLIIPAGKDRPLSASLLPEVHLAILRTSQIYTGLQGFFAQPGNEKKIRSVSTLIFISGPSRTADIEMTLTIGVHGPKRVYALCIP